ncbi:MAG: sugar ABC transporter permease [Spirochaetota bacterium]
MVKRNREFLPWIAPLVLFLLITTFFPILYTVVMGFFDNYLPARRLAFAGIGNFITTFLDPLFYQVLANTVVYVAVSVFFHLLFGFLAAVFLDRKGRGRRLASRLRVVFIVPWLIAWSVAAAIWQLILNPSGILNGILSGLGISPQPIPWLSDPRGALFWIILITIWKALPFYMMLIYAALTTVPDELYESADLDGASLPMKIYHISFKSVLPTILTLMILDIIWSLRMYDLVALTTGGGPLNGTRILSLYVYSTAFEKLQFGLASAQGFIIMLISCSMVLAYNRLLEKKEA